MPVPELLPAWGGGSGDILVSPTLVAAGTNPPVQQERAQRRGSVWKIGAAAPESPPLVYENYNYFDFSPQTA